MDEEILDENYIITEINDNIVKYIESIFRNSRFYKAYISQISHESNHIDTFFEAYNEEAMTIELHHVIYLNAIVTGCILEHLSKNDTCTIWDILNDICDLHYKDEIPIIFLAKNVHELYHSGQYDLPIDDIHWGNYKAFIQKYYKYIDMSIYVKYGCLSQETLESYGQAS